MSADNGVYILETLNGEIKEYRVAHLSASIVCELDWAEDSGEPDIGNLEIMIDNARNLWEGVTVYADEKSASKEALKIYDNIGYVEYGIQKIKIDKEF